MNGPHSLSQDIDSTFKRSEFCTPGCGISQFEDWLHTPLCEEREEAATERRWAEEEAAAERAAAAFVPAWVRRLDKNAKDFTGQTGYVL